MFIMKSIFRFFDWNGVVGCKGFFLSLFVSGFFFLFFIFLINYIFNYSADSGIELTILNVLWLATMSPVVIRRLNDLAWSRIWLLLFWVSILPNEYILSMGMGFFIAILNFCQGIFILILVFKRGSHFGRDQPIQ
jgi:hypothetical protein